MSNPRRFGVEPVVQGLNRFLGNIEAMNRGIQSLGDNINITKNRLEVMGASFDRVTNRWRDQSGRFVSAADVADRLQQALDNVGNAAERASEQAKKSGGSFSEFLQVLGLNNNAIVKFGLKLAGLGGPMQALLIVVTALKGAFAALQFGLGLVGKAFNALISPVRNLINNFKEFVTRVAAVATGVLIRDAIFGLLRAIKELSTEVLGAAANFQTLTVRLETLLARQVRATQTTLSLGESLQQASLHAQDLLGWVKDLSLQVPVDVEDIGNVTAFALAMGFGKEQAQELTSAIIDYTSALGLGSEVTERIIFNFGQMKAAGKVTATEMRDLARGAFFPLTQVLEEAANILGVAGENLTEFKNKAAEGQIDINTFFQAFVNIVNRDLPGAAERMGRTLEGVRTRFLNFLKTIVGIEVFGPIFQRFADIAANALDRLLNPKIKETATLIGQVLLKAFNVLHATITQQFLPAIGNLARAFGIVAPSARQFVTVMLAVAITISRVLGQISILINNLANRLSGNFDTLSERAAGWGFNFIKAFAAGMAAAVKFIVQVITAIARILASWFKPGSPPRIAPLIDKWGAETFTEWIRGFLSADFSLFNNVANLVEDFLRSIPGGIGEDNKGLIPAILGSREVIAKTVRDFRNGLLSANEAVNRIVTSIPRITSEFRAYVDALISVEKAQKAVDEASSRVEKAQKNLQRITEKYNAILADLNRQLRGVTEEFDDQERLAKINKAINTGLLTQQERARLEAEKRAIQIRAQIRSTEDQRDAETAVAQTQLDQAQAAQDAAQAQLDAAKAQLDASQSIIEAQIKQNELIQEQIALLERLAKQGKEAGAEGTPFEFPPIGLPEIPETNISDLLDQIFLDAQKLADKFVAQLGDIFSPFSDLFGENGPLAENLNALSELWNSIFGPSGFVNSIDLTLAKSSIMALADTIRDPLGVSLDNLSTSFGGISPAVAVFQFVLGAVTGLVSSVGVTIIGVVTGISRGIEFFASQWQEVWDEATAAFGENINIIGKLVIGIYALIRGIFGFILGFVSGFIESFVSFFQNLYNRLVGGSIIPDMMSEIERVITETLASVQRFIEDKINAIQTFWEEKWQAIADFLNGIGETITTFIEEHLTPLYNFIKDTLTNALNDFVDNVLTPFKDGIKALFEPIDTLIGKIGNLIGKLTQNIHIPQWLRILLGKSPPPLAEGISTVVKEMRRLSSVELPRLATSLNMNASVNALPVQATSVDRSVNINVNAAYSQVQSPAGIYYDVSAAINQARI